MIAKPRVCVLTTDGTNCDGETSYAFDKAGGAPERVHINQLREGARTLKDYQILAIPGGFSYGDDVASGKILAVELISYLRESLEEFTSRDTLIIGICNGFQVLVRTGLLPFGSLGTMEATLSLNNVGRFDCRWVTLETGMSPCLFTQDLLPDEFQLPIAHGEGRFFTTSEVLQRLNASWQIALRYRSSENPNGSLDNIAGICDPSGHIFGLMPHPERRVETFHHPNWRRGETEPHGLRIFQNAINYFA